MSETSTRVPEQISVTLASAERAIDFWAKRSCRAVTEVAELRHQLAAHDAEANAACQEWDVKCEKLEQQLAQVTALVPEAESLDEVVDIAYESARTWLQGLGRDRALESIREIKNFAARIRDWRGEQGQEQGDD